MEPIAPATGPGGAGGGGATPPAPIILLIMLEAFQVVKMVLKAFANASNSASDNLSTVPLSRKFLYLRYF